MKIIAHRGASGEFPENTLEAFEQAIRQECDGIELDIQYHRESQQFYLFHDDYILADDKIDSNKQALLINQFSSQALDKHCRQHQIPTLEQALECINGRCLLNIEIKANYLEEKDYEDLIALLEKQLNMALTKSKFTLAQFIISSFNHPVLSHIKQKMPLINIATLIAHTPLYVTDIIKLLDVRNIHINIASISHNIIEQAHSLNKEVWVYTVNSEKNVEHCKNLNVDAIFTDFPEKTKKFLKII